jgi:LacI family sucrose operon transcriptional repressor
MKQYMKWKKEIIGNMTIKEIAQLAQVSSAAVSRYLNGGYISEEKKERIRAAIEKTGYHPSAQARNLRTKRARLIGVVAPRLSSESVARVTDGIGEVLAEKQFQMLLTVTNNQSDKELETMRLFENYPVDGIILIATVISRKHEVFFEQSANRGNWPVHG